MKPEEERTLEPLLENESIEHAVRLEPEHGLVPRRHLVCIFHEHGKVLTCADLRDPRGCGVVG